MSIPTGHVAVPPRVKALADGDAVQPVWRSEVGAVTWRITGVHGIRYVKHGPLNAETTAEGEAERLRWAAPHTPVPGVRLVGRDAMHEWLVTDGLPGSSAVDPRWLDSPRVAVRAVGEGLRALHEALPTDTCPFTWDVPSRIRRAAARGIVVPDALRIPPPLDRVVVCHGDACAPNTLLDDDGAWSAHVDLGALGLGDRWSDIAVAAMSTRWNYGPGWEDELLAAYGVPRDDERMRYYQQLWDAT